MDRSYASTKVTRDQTTNHTILKYKEAGPQKTRRLRVFTQDAKSLLSSSLPVCIQNEIVIVSVMVVILNDTTKV